MTTRVYTPNGEPFDIPRREVADTLILDRGWTQTPPQPKLTAEKEAKDEAKKQKRRKYARKSKSAELTVDSE